MCAVCLGPCCSGPAHLHFAGELLPADQHRPQVQQVQPPQPQHRLAQHLQAQQAPRLAAGCTIMRYPVLAIGQLVHAGLHLMHGQQDSKHGFEVPSVRVRCLQSNQTFGTRTGVNITAPSSTAQDGAGAHFERSICVCAAEARVLMTAAGRCTLSCWQQAALPHEMQGPKLESSGARGTHDAHTK
jgi:hypothetical protein